MYADARPGDAHALHADTTIAREVLGFAATIPFEERIERYLSWLTRAHPTPSHLLEPDVENWTMPRDVA